MFKKMAALMIVATLLISPGFVFAFGLGAIKIHSALNQPINAEIELIGFNANDLDEIKVSLASQRIFERFGVPRPYVLTQLKFTPGVSAGRPVIKVSSRQAVREPFLVLLLDVHWSQGKLLREYTVLLDPPVFGDQARAAMQAPKATPQAPVARAEPPPLKPPPGRQITPPSKTAAADSAQKKMLESASRPPASAEKPQTYITVKRGDTLWGLASSQAGQYGVSINQMMLAIKAANPHGFFQDNINNLKSGVVLRIPADSLKPLFSASGPG